MESSKYRSPVDGLTVSGLPMISLLAAKASPDALSRAMGMWSSMTGKLFDLEAKLMKQASATELQTTTVVRLKQQVCIWMSGITSFICAN